MTTETTEPAALSDAYAVDRSHLERLPVWPMSPEMEKAEERLSAIRASATWMDRLEAWKALSADPRAEQVGAIQ